MDAVDHHTAPAWLASYGKLRAESYLLLASLLGQPSESTCELLRNLTWDDAIPERLDHALRDLCRAGRDFTPAAMEVEFSRLFIAPGRSTMMPYASWYRERKIQARTLAMLRSDLIRLGIGDLLPVGPALGRVVLDPQSMHLLWSSAHHAPAGDIRHRVLLPCRQLVPGRLGVAQHFRHGLGRRVEDPCEYCLGP